MQEEEVADEFVMSYVCLCVQYLARLRMELDVANKHLETVEVEKHKLIQERDQVHLL